MIAIQPNWGSYFPYSLPLHFIAAHNPKNNIGRGNMIVFEVDDEFISSALASWHEWDPSKPLPNFKVPKTVESMIMADFGAGEGYN